MAGRNQVLVVSATARELAPPGNWRTLLCGVGPVDAAAATAAEIGRSGPAVILHVGIAGCRAHMAGTPGALVIGSESRYCDAGGESGWITATLIADADLVAAAQRALPAAAVHPIGTSARVGGTSGCDVEAMEGFGVLRAARLAGIPAIEIRAISNDIDEPDRTRWHFDAAFAAITSATPLLVAELLKTIEGRRA